MQTFFRELIFFWLCYICYLCLGLSNFVLPEDDLNAFCLLVFLLLQLLKFLAIGSSLVVSLLVVLFDYSLIRIMCLQILAYQAPWGYPFGSLEH